MRDEHAAAVAAMGNQLNPALVEASQRLYEPHHPAEVPAGFAVTRDISYGPHERNRLDVFINDRDERDRPVLIFVHGGGFVRGDKSMPGSPYYDNVGLWAAANGFVGVTISYRLAPAHPYPAGAADVAAALAWIHANIGSFGGDPGGVVLMGQSAGATHAATYAARPDLYPGGAIGIDGIVLLSGVYDFTMFERAPNVLEYVGRGPDDAATASSLDGLVAAGVPILFAISEYDPPHFHAQGMRLADALFARDGRFPNVVYLPHHNHITQIAHLNGTDIDDPLLSIRLAEFVRTTARAFATVFES